MQAITKTLRLVTTACLLMIVATTLANEDGSASFDYSQNEGLYVIRGSSGATFSTMWSSCNKDRIYAYKDYVKLVGFGASLTSFPADPFAFAQLDWELRAPAIDTGSYVVFMNSAGQFLCAHITNVKREKDGASADLVSFDYRIYDDAKSTADVVLEKHNLAQANYRSVGKDSGSVTYHYEYNEGHFVIDGATGQHFEMLWTSCNTDRMYVYKDYVKAVAPASKWTDFPASTAGFSSLDWSQRVPTIYTGEFFVLENSEGQYLVVRLNTVKTHSENRADDYITFDYRIYGSGSHPVYDGTDQAPLTVLSSGTKTFDFSANGGCHTLSASGCSFVTKWSTCGRESLYAYRDKVKLLGVFPACTAFPATRADMLRFDWEQRATSINEGGYAVFLNASGELLCAKLTNIQSKDWGAAANSLTIDYLIYAKDDVLLGKINKNWADAQATYRTTGNTGTASFRYTCNAGAFSVFGMDGAAFVTKWSGCNRDTIYAYRDNVSGVALGGSWASYPTSADAFAGLDWTARVVTVKEGGWVVFRNKAGGYLCARVNDVRAVSRGDTQDLVIFDYKIYAPTSQTPPVVPTTSIVTVDLATAGSVDLPLATDAETFDIQLVKTINTPTGSRRVNLSSCLDVSRLANGSIDLANAEVKPEIAAEVLDTAHGAKLELSSDKIMIETANTREGLTYEFYESTTLEDLSAKVKTTKLGDGTPFKPTSNLAGSQSAFFLIKVKK